MAGKVAPSPALPTFGRRAGDVRGDIEGLHDIIKNLIKALFVVFRNHAIRMNGAFMADGTEPMLAPLQLVQYTVVTLPDPIPIPGSIVYVPDEVGGPTIALSDGGNWIRTSDGATVS